MSFLHPGLLAAGLACVAIPILIHLLMNRRRKPVRWAAMRFLLEAYRRQQRRLLIERWLLLATRCLIFALLAAALARPMLGPLFGESGMGGSRTVYLLIDNSLTARLAMETGDAEAGTALDRHKRTARAVLTAISEARTGSGGGFSGGRVAVVLLASPAESLVLPPSADLEAVSRLIDEVRATDARADVPSALTLVAEHARTERSDGTATAPPVVVVLSDMRVGVLDAADPTAISGAMPAGVFPVGTRVLVAADESPADAVNTAIVSLEPLRPIFFGGREGQAVAQQVRVVLARSEAGAGSESVGATTVRLRLADGQGDARGDTRSGAEVNTPGQTSPTGTAVVRWTAGQQQAEAVVTIAGEMPAGLSSSAVLHARIDEDALDADNVFARAVDVRQALRVGIVSPRRFESQVRADRLEPAQWLRLAITAAGEASMEVAGGVETVEIDPAALDSARLSSMDALLIPRPDLIADASWTRLRLFVDSGGLLMVFPPAQVSTHLWSDPFARAMDLGMTLPREAIVMSAAGAEGGVPTEGATLRLGGSNVSAVREVGERGRNDGDQGEGLLSMISGELPELMRPVRVFRHLPPTAAVPDAEGFRRGVLMSLNDGSLVLWAKSPAWSSGADGESSGTTAGPGGVSEPGRAPGRERTGLVVYCSLAMDPEWTDLPARPLMVPLMQELLRQGVGAARAPTVLVAGQTDGGALPRRTVQMVAVGNAWAGPIDAGGRSVGSGRAGVGSRGDERVEAESRVAVDPLTGRLAAPVRNAGLYRAIDDGGAVTAVVSVTPDASGSRIGVQSAEAIATVLTGTLDPADVADTGGPSRVVFIGSGDRPESVDVPSAATAVRSALGARDEDSSFAWRLLVAVLVLAVLEMFLSRMASHASVAGSSAMPSGGAPAGVAA